MIEEGDNAPQFCLDGIDEKGDEKEISLKGMRGERFILYFYPKDSTPGCTTEACDFRDNFTQFNKQKIRVIGVSPDSISSHKKFMKKKELNFTLLSDYDKSVAEKYGAYGEKKMYGTVSKGIIRSTFLINEKGKIAKVWRNVKATGHVGMICKVIA